MLSNLFVHFPPKLAGIIAHTLIFGAAALSSTAHAALAQHQAVSRVLIITAFLEPVVYDLNAVLDPFDLPSD